MRFYEFEQFPRNRDPAGSETGRPVTTFTYLADGQLDTVTEKLTDSTSRLTSFDYDGMGRLQTVTLPQVWDYDASAYVTPQYAYAYDEFSRTVMVSDPRGYDTNYVYDDLHRVTKVIGAHPTDPDATGETDRPVTSRP